MATRRSTSVVLARWVTACLSIACVAVDAVAQVNGTVNRIIKFDSPTTGANSRLYDNGTNVGIGTTAPQDFLHLFRGTPRSTVGVLMGNGSTGSGRRGFLVDFHASGGAELWNFENSSMWFGTNNALRMTITSGGRVGIGTTAPADTLHLRAGTVSTVGVLMGNGSLPSGRRGFLVDFHASGGAELWNFENSDMWFGTNNIQRVMIARDGRVGIGGPPTAINYVGGIQLRPLLDVQGEMRLGTIPVWDGPDDHDLTWSRGSSNGVDFDPDRRLISREGSSRRYKTDIQPAGENFAKILAAEPRRYQMREGYGVRGVWNFGYIAEELHEAGLEKLVIYDEQGRPDGVCYKKVAVYVNEVVKTQQKTIEKLQADVAALQECVRRLSESQVGLLAAAGAKQYAGPR